MPAASRIGDTHTCSIHVGGKIITGCPTVLIGEKLAARVTDVAECEGPEHDMIEGGSRTVFIGCQRAARVLDRTNGGHLTSGEPTVQIAVYAPVGARATAQGDAKGDSLRVKLDDRCAAQTWPNISSDCVVDANGAPTRKTVRTITIEERTGPNSSALVRKPALEIAAR